MRPALFLRQAVKQVHAQALTFIWCSPQHAQQCRGGSPTWYCAPKRASHQAEKVSAHSEPPAAVGREAGQGGAQNTHLQKVPRLLGDGLASFQELRILGNLGIDRNPSPRQPACNNVEHIPGAPSKASEQNHGQTESYPEVTKRGSAHAPDNYLRRTRRAAKLCQGWGPNSTIYPMRPGLAKLFPNSG